MSNSSQEFDELLKTSTAAIKQRKITQAQNAEKRDDNWQCRRSFAVFRDAVRSHFRRVHEARGPKDFILNAITVFNYSRFGRHISTYLGVSLPTYYYCCKPNLYTF